MIGYPTVKAKITALGMLPDCLSSKTTPVIKTIKEKNIHHKLIVMCGKT